MAFICLDCGSIEWDEIWEERVTRTLSDDGEEEVVDCGKDELSSVFCGNCLSSRLLEFWFADEKKTKEIVKEIKRREGEERIVFVLKQALTGNIVINCIMENGVTKDVDKETIIEMLQDYGVDGKEIVIFMV